MDGFDLGIAALLRVLGARRRRAPRAARNGRAGLGRQPGLVHPRRRRGVRRVAAALCRVVLRLLFRDPARAARASSCGRSASAFATRSTIRAGATCGTGSLIVSRHRAAADLRRRVRQPVSRRAVPLRRHAAHDLRRRPDRPAASVRAARRAWSSLSMLLMHGAAWVAHEGRRDRSPARAARAARHGSRSYSSSRYVLAGVWLAFGVTGYAISGAVVADGPSNPLLKQVAIGGSWLADGALGTLGLRRRGDRDRRGARACRCSRGARIMAARSSRARSRSQARSCRPASRCSRS